MSALIGNPFAVFAITRIAQLSPAFNEDLLRRTSARRKVKLASGAG
jgi:hypothetical protein